ncbi:uncharacterized protein UV8b_05715 [Ustilaginoidea virens]|uniref:SprT-like domain-containing protein n=1 Tax=Ustilaginoidea virens TaxID=1159556 RepID=A0A063C9Z2_USTVR|nr:uncharacterized protein UV8b_05715 [Ustilaginoidea virens]QUC21472.1 hypothetical protein UV8b_05715 [Ustilaginoidea virens]GAO13460.1 hypothetical protein UVI_02016550 [Ustilaginoidea virens]
MAFWVVGVAGGGGGGTPFRVRKQPYVDSYGHAGPGDGSETSHRWPEFEHYEEHGRNTSDEHLAESVPIRNLAFLVIREGSDDANQDNCHRNRNYHPPPTRNHALCPAASTPSPSPSPKSPVGKMTSHQVHSPSCPSVRLPLERTESGLSISSDASAHHHHCPSSAEAENDTSLLGDLEAARLVREHVASYRRRFPDSQPERILRALINPKSRGADFPLDNDALRSIFSAANELFFASRLTRRVTWDWSHSASEQYANHIVGTTALRRSARFGGWETLIVLSSPILRDTKYNRRLLISTFLHEMMHSFMFVACGLKAKQFGGHTEGFHQVAGIIDDWAGKDCLHLRDMEADLARWRGDDFSCADGRRHADADHDMDRAEQDYVEQVQAWSTHPAQLRGDALQTPSPLPSLPHRQAAPEKWQWYEREDFGDRLQHVAQVQYVP